VSGWAIAPAGVSLDLPIEGFREFSNPRGVVVRGTSDLADAFLPPYGPVLQAIVASVFEGGASAGS
jgi:coniferyl-aldehyde dehydrogenase